MGSCFLNKYGLYFDRCQNQQFFPRSRKFGLPVLYDSGLVRSDRAVQPPGYEYSDGCKKNARVYFFFSAKKREGSQPFRVGLTVRSDDVFMRVRNWSVMQRRDLRPIVFDALIDYLCVCWLYLCRAVGI